MNPSHIVLYFAAILLTSVVIGMAYISTPYHDKATAEAIKQWLSPLTLVGYICVILASALASMGV